MKDGYVMRYPNPGGKVGAIMATAMAAVSLSACTSSTGPSSDPSGAPTRSEVTADEERQGLTAGMGLPLEAYLTSYTDQLTVQQAQGMLERACMAKMGFDYDPPAPVQDPGDLGQNGANMGRRYGISDPKTARTFGYHLEKNPESSPTYEISMEMQYALMGTDSGIPNPPARLKAKDIPKGGCTGQARRKVPLLDEDLASQLNYDSLEKSKADPGVQRAISAWSDCMAKQGHDVLSPLDVPELSNAADGGNPSENEIAVAVADVECKTSTNLIRIWFSVEKKIQKQQIEKNQLVLDATKKENDEALKAAADLVG